MQTFLPNKCFVKSAEQLDYRRLGKQRIEACTIHNILTGKAKSNAWRHHPAVIMWRGFEDALALYYNCVRFEWIKRGYKNTMPVMGYTSDNIKPPSWLGDENFHKSHRSNLLRKAPEYYQQFNWNVPNDLPYVWPT